MSTKKKKMMLKTEGESTYPPRAHREETRALSLGCSPSAQMVMDADWWSVGEGLAQKGQNCLDQLAIGTN